MWGYCVIESFSAVQFVDISVVGLLHFSRPVHGCTAVGEWSGLAGLQSES